MGFERAFGDQNFDDWLDIQCGEPWPNSQYSDAGPSEDGAEMLGVSTGPGADLEGVAIDIRYRDSKGNISARRIQLVRIVPEGEETRIWAFCRLRHAFRSFLGSRIVEIVDPSTGEMPADPHAFLRGLALESEDQRMAEAHNSIMAGLRILAALARSDGRLHADEVQAMVRYADDRALDLGFECDAEWHSAVAHVATRLWPTSEQVRLSMKRIREEEGHGRLLARHLQTLAHADGGLGMAERRFIVDLLSSN